MKLMFAIVHDDDCQRLTEELNHNDFSVTKLCSTGGFLKSGNTTMLIGVEEDMVDTVVGIIDKNSKARKQGVKPANPGGMGKMVIPAGKEITIGGATLFITDVERFEKV